MKTYDKITADLGLVKRRARLRGWEVMESMRYHAGDFKLPVVMVKGSPGWATFRSADGVLLESSTQNGSLMVHVLTRPRLTLENLLSEPREGWTVLEVDEKLLWWHKLAEVVTDRCGKLADNPTLRADPGDVFSVLEAMRVVWELMAELGEVVP